MRCPARSGSHLRQVGECRRRVCSSFLQMLEQRINEMFGDDEPSGFRPVEVAR
jgi:hypothetical protein